MAFWSPQPLTEMSTRNLAGCKFLPARKADNLTAICLENVGASTPHNPLGLHGLLQEYLYLLPYLCFSLISLCGVVIEVSLCSVSCTSLCEDVKFLSCSCSWWFSVPDDDPNADRNMYNSPSKTNVTVILLLLCLYSPLLGLGRFFSFLILYRVGRTPWTEDQPVARPLPTLEQHKKE
jgi:hypothetical protein